MAKVVGWILAIALGLGVVGLILFKVLKPTPDGPTRATTTPGFLDVHKVEAPLKPLIGYELTEEGDAGDDYAKAIEAIQKEHNAYIRIYDNFFRHHNNTLSPADLAKLEQITMLIKPALHKKNMTYNYRHTPKEMTVSFMPPGLRDFAGRTDGIPEGGRYAHRIGLLQIYEMLANHYFRTKNYAQLREICKDMLVLGHHMANEGLRPFMTLEGLQNQVNTCEKLLYVASDLNDTDLQKAARAYQADCEGVLRNAQDKQKIIWTLAKRDGGRSYGPPPGDLFNIVENDKSRQYRIDGILALGVLRFGQSGHRGNYARTMELLEKYSNSKDPLFKAAAEVAKTCTSRQIEEWNRP